MEKERTKVVVIGGTGRIGSKVVAKLNEEGYEAVAASPNTGVNTLTGEGLAEVMKGASVAVDVSNSPSFDETPATEFFKTSTANLLRSESAAGVKQHVALSVVGTNRLAQNKEGIGGYFRAKLAQENLIKDSHIPYSIVHATQFFEFIKDIAASATEGETVRLPAVLIQPMAADDVAEAVVRAATSLPVNGIVEVGGPEQFRLDELIRMDLAALNDPREVVTDPKAGYYGSSVKERTLVPGSDAQLGSIRFEDWIKPTTLSKVA